MPHDRDLATLAVGQCTATSWWGRWFAGTELAGAVIASGAVVVESDLKKVQHPIGGVVDELNVHDGDHVNAGDVLVRLTVPRRRRTSLYSPKVSTSYTHVELGSRQKEIA